MIEHQQLFRSRRAANWTRGLLLGMSIFLAAAALAAPGAVLQTLLFAASGTCLFLFLHLGRQFEIFENLSIGKEEWERTVDSLSELVAVINPDGRIRRVNRALAQRLGVSPRELVGRLCHEVFDAASTPPEDCSHQCAILKQQNHSCERVIPHLGGRFESVTEPIYAAGVSATAERRIVGWVHRLRDITEERRLEEETRRFTERLETEVRLRTRDLASANVALERANRHKTLFLASMSHELRTPLTSILGFAEVLADAEHGPLNQEQAQFVESIRQSGRHLLQLINDLLDLFKMETGRLELHPEPLSLSELFAEATTALSPQATARGVTLEARPGALPHLQADRGKLKQVLFNLLDNAIKFTPAGGKVWVEAVAANDNAVQITVADTGIGIPDEQQAIIFEPFEQVSGSGIHRQHAGAGLGLSICRRLVEMHGGSMRLESEPGRGSRFQITLPRDFSPRRLPLVRHDRGYLLDQLATEVDRSARYSRAFALLLGSVVLGDAGREDEGEMVLERVGQRLSANQRRSDLLIWYERQTFAMLLPETPVEGAALIQQRVRTMVEHHLEENPSLPQGVLISTLAVYPKDGQDAEQLLATATASLARTADAVFPEAQGAAN